MLSYSVGISAGNSNQTWAPFHSSVPACASPLDFTSGHRGLTNKAVISYLDDKFRGGGGGGGRTGKKGNRSVGGQESVRLSISRAEGVGLTSLTNLSTRHHNSDSLLRRRDTILKSTGGPEGKCV